MRCVSILPKAMNVYMCQHSVGEKCKFLLNIHVTCPALRTQNLLVLQQIGGLSQPKHCSPVDRLDLGAVVLVVDLGPVVLVVDLVQWYWWYIWVQWYWWYIWVQWYWWYIWFQWYW